MQATSSGTLAFALNFKNEYMLIFDLARYGDGQYKIYRVQEFSDSNVAADIQRVLGMVNVEVQGEDA